MLGEVRRVLSALGTAGAGQIAAELETDRESVDAALAFWMNRGDVCEVRVVAGGCGGCSGCGPQPASRVSSCCSDVSAADESVSFIAYRWIGNG